MKLRLAGKALDLAYARLPANYALFPMIATRRITGSDNFPFCNKKNTGFRHIVTHSRYRAWLLSKPMRPAEAIVDGKPVGGAA